MKELNLWFLHLIKLIPGKIGCKIRNILMPYKNGKNVTIWELVHIATPSMLSVGDNVTINRYSYLQAGGGIQIGNNVLIGPHVIIYSKNHKFTNKNELINNQGYESKRVEIGDNVWIAANVIILPGVRIGNNCVIGAGTLVNKDVENNCLMVGNPARLVKKI